jgi:hypothetical protein
MSNIRLLQWTQQIDWQRWDQIKRLDGVDKYLGGEARRALADSLVRDAAIRRVITEPDPQSFDGSMGARVTWSLGVADKADTATLARQIEAARAEGMRQGAELVREAAARYDGRDGGCAGVIASSLYDAARVLEATASATVAEAERIEA